MNPVSNVQSGNAAAMAQAARKVQTPQRETAAQEAVETPAATRQQAAGGDAQAVQKLAKEQATSQAAPKASAPGSRVNILA